MAAGAAVVTPAVDVEAPHSDFECPLLSHH